MLYKWSLLMAGLYLIINVHREVVAAQAPNGQRYSDTHTNRAFLGHNGLTATLHHIFNHCLNDNKVVHCFKIQGTRLLGRALKFQNINIIEGVALVKRLDNETRTARTVTNADINLTNRDLENLSMKSLNSVLNERFYNFVQSRQIQVNMPRLLAFGQHNGQWIIQYIMGWYGGANNFEQGMATEEGRKKKDKGDNYMGPFIAAVMLKAAILKMAYHSIAIVAGKALIVGKIALIISAIIGLKKLVSSEGNEKTTYEIVKHPQVASSHTYSSSHASEYDGGHESGGGGGGGGGGSYHRSMDEEMMMQDKAYGGWMPTPTSS